MSNSPQRMPPHGAGGIGVQAPHHGDFHARQRHAGPQEASQARTEPARTADPSLQLLESLMGSIQQAGILPDVSGSALPSNPCAEVAFTVESLKARHAGVISALYEQRPHQCQQCGIRFAQSSKQDLHDHLDWHFRATKEKKKVASKCRQWYHPVEAWLDLTDARGKDERQRSKVFESGGASQQTEEKKESNVQVLKQKNASCSVCQERLDCFYDDEEEEWMYRDAVRNDDALYHKACFDAKTIGGASTAASASPGSSNVPGASVSGVDHAVKIEPIVGDPRPLKKQRI